MDMAANKPLKIVIVGGGIAGLCAAIALRGDGREITILERSRLLSEIGATISLQPNASRILDKVWRLGPLLDKANGTVDEGFRIYNAEGRLVNEVPLLIKTEYGGDRIMYHRQDLHKALQLAATDPTRPGPPATVKTSANVVACDCEAGLLSLQDGGTVYGDVIIGADGIHSVLRNTVTGQDVKTIPTGLSAYRCIIPTTELERQAPDFYSKIKPSQPFTSMMMAHSCRLIMGPARAGSIFSIVGLVPDEKMNEDPDSKQSWVSKGDLQQMLETYKDFPEWVKTSFSVAEDIGLWQLRDIDPLPTWTRGRVLLIGDASHAMRKLP
jgi:salicylate hydroxylase